MNILHGHEQQTCSMGMQAWICGIDMQRGHEAWRYSKDVKHGHADRTRGIDMDRQYEHAAWTYIQHGNV
jgi:hypothetical protein